MMYTEICTYTHAHVYVCMYIYMYDDTHVYMDISGEPKRHGSLMRPLVRTSI